MLSIRKLGRGAEHYYIGLQVENYYFEGGEPPGLFVSGRDGRVTRSALGSLLRGFDPDTGAALVQNAGSDRRIPAYDLTFSPPKSFSVTWALAPRPLADRLQQAHAESVAHVLGVAEAIAGRSRMGSGGRWVVPAKLTFALFEHGTARSVGSILPDPQLHTHCVVPNVGVRPDGTTGTLVSKYFYQHQRLLTSVYRYELARRVRKIGFEVVDVGERRGFRLTCTPEELERHFSKRRQQIENSLEAHGTSGAAASEEAALATRQSKRRTPPRADLIDAWKSAAADLGHDISWPKEGRDRDRSSRIPPTATQRRLVSAMIKREAQALSEYKRHFTREELVCRVFDKAVGDPMPIAEVAWAVHRYLKRPGILRITDERGQELYRTRPADDARRELRAVVRQEVSTGAHRVFALRADEGDQTRAANIAERLRKEGSHVVLATRSKEAATALARESRRERADGTKHKGSEVETTSLAKFLWNLDRGSFHVGPLPPSWLRETARALGAITEKARRYLAWSSERRPLKIGRRSIVIVDAAHELTAKELTNLVAAARKHRARVVLLGEDRGVYGDVVLHRFSRPQNQRIARVIEKSRRNELEPEVP